ncbi:Putative ubiquitin-conjugating enzyme E2, ubiquitin-conjugating enzyme/RWD [Septoria linicola]|uniref:Ubiquitin-conjugating enzyme E2, ubiquitin-conjugating enzyme/RWD n=1 Tax=Septoria linicola TaxID=215465 RepID=A0A9Q9EJ82_9PEZI|nr:putative ubiquitin-conjugating enzyme E2, ubiquitin-conjugating enzyme/RWD [Septoria linicola]USW51887.1 Putative ubiquitin-conjugating enzyme E2, ubiquitin-conjugating enzyme/RWD [Septoria linicola]
MAFHANLLTDELCKGRLLRDIDELRRKPYPGIELHVHESDIRTACLVLTPAGEEPLHLTLHFTSFYPLEPPDVTLQSSISHPNVFDDRLCLNMLTSDDGYTPAYTLKGICIQLLSFFASDTMEQMWGEHGGKVDRKKWQAGGAS